MLYLWEKARLFIRFLRSRAFAVSMLSVVLALVVFRITATTNRVYIADNQGRSVAFAMEKRTQDILDAYPADPISGQAPGFSGISGGYAQISTGNTFSVSVTADGKTQSYYVERGNTVGDLLYEIDLKFDANDLLSPAPEKPLSPGDSIVLQRVEYEEYVTEHEIPFETVYKNSSLLRIGSKRTVQEGKNGSKRLTHLRRTVDGVQEDALVLGEHILTPPVEQIVAVGAPEPISKLDFNVPLDENGNPKHYKQLLTNQVATGYSARPGAKTASGRMAITGHVAVNPNEIPYGSKLYITSANNHFVYGYAIAADTGTGLLADIVDIDLFYDTYAESVLNGRRIVNIYVLE